MVYFLTKYPNFGKIWRDLERKILAYFLCNLEYITAIWYILRKFGNLVTIWFIFHVLGILCQDKSGNPGRHE
jgi:hypothetical protein